MPHRKIRFGEGEWDVWDVRPEARPSRLDSSEFKDGWLCFQCGSERRRLIPIPDGWDQLEDNDLHPLFDRARPVVPARADGRANLANAFRTISITRDAAAAD